MSVHVLVSGDYGEPMTFRILSSRPGIAHLTGICVVRLITFPLLVSGTLGTYQRQLKAQFGPPAS